MFLLDFCASLTHEAGSSSPGILMEHMCTAIPALLLEVDQVDY